MVGLAQRILFAGGGESRTEGYSRTNKCQYDAFNSLLKVSGDSRAAQTFVGLSTSTTKQTGQSFCWHHSVAQGKFDAEPMCLGGALVV